MRAECARHFCKFWAILHSKCPPFKQRYMTLGLIRSFCTASKFRRSQHSPVDQVVSASGRFLMRHQGSKNKKAAKPMAVWHAQQWSCLGLNGGRDAEVSKLSMGCSDGLCIDGLFTVPVILRGSSPPHASLQCNMGLMLSDSGSQRREGRHC